MIDKDTIRKHMEEIQDRIEYRFHNVRLLEEAMYAERVHTENEGRNHREYTNGRIAIVGDSVLKLVLSDFLYRNPAKYNIRMITDRKRDSERNKVLNQVIHDMSIIDHAYNSKHFHSEKNVPKQENVMDSEHNAYMEGIIGAVYFDSGFDRVKEWILYWLVPRLEEAKRDLSKEETD